MTESMETCREEITLVQLLASFLRCPFCTRHLEKPLILYPELGYYVCNMCTKKSEGVDGQIPEGGKRDRLIEQLCFGTRLKCSYSAAGCQFTGTTVLMVAAHEELCLFSLQQNSNNGETDNSNAIEYNSSAMIEDNTIVEGFPGQSFDELLVAEMNCPVCLTRIPLPIKECENSHRLCHRCFDRLRECPVCRGPKSSMSNIILEHIYSLIQVPCRNTDRGCNVRDNVSSVTSHEESCEFNSKPCPLVFNRTCRWRGLRSEIIDHCRASHFADLSVGPQCSGVFECENHSSFQLIYYDGIFFNYSWLKFGDSLCFSVNYSGPRSEFQYSFELDATFHNCGSSANLVIIYKCSHIGDDEDVGSIPYLCFETSTPISDDCMLNYVLKITRNPRDL